MTEPLVPEPRWAGEELAEPAPGRLALWLAAWTTAATEPLLFLVRSESRAGMLAGAVRSVAPGVEVLALPAWDSPPGDRVPPSRGVAGARMATLRRLAAKQRGPRLVVASSEAATVLLPGREVLADALPELAVGEPLDPNELRARLLDHGYAEDERVDEPGEMAFRGAVVDLFAADAEDPSRIELDGGRIASIRRYDAATQRSVATLDRLRIGAASEPSPASASLFDLLPGARLVLDGGAEARRDAFLEQVADMLELGVGAARPEADAAEARPRYLSDGAWQGAVAGSAHLRLAPDDAPKDRLPRWRGRSGAAAALRRFVGERLAAGDRVVLAAAADRSRRRLVEPVAGRLDRKPVVLGGWEEIEGLAPGTLAALRADLPTGFAVPGTVVVAADDVVPLRSSRGGAPPADALLGLGGLQPGDLVVHAEHGIGRLHGLETVATAGSAAEEHLLIEYAGEQRLLTPALELDRIWRYGTAEAEVKLDRIDSKGWSERRDAIAAEVELAAERLCALARERAAATAPRIEPPREALDRFARGFPFELTDDQAAAIDAALADLARGTPPMDRLVVGDVGFGKTEVALRAAAATVLSGRQVAVLAPTTLLVRQHLETFRRRFRRLGVRVEQLSRLARGAEARATRDGLADGSVAVVIGTHALASPGLRFKELALVVTDEEQRFGSRHKEAIGRLKRGVHLLSMSATPIPRTLQSALAGIRELSLIATPPVRRRPVRTLVLPFDPALVRRALERERRRGGRSFVVVPRIADLAPMAERLAQAAPGFDLVTAHGRMRADELDAKVLAFAGGRHDVLLTTSIVEAGLDIPRADTMIVWRPERFGLAQLHQLRGRVGRGREQAVCYLLPDPEAPLSPAAERRLRTLATLDELGAGFLVSARDLDQRGAGDLLGVEQSGHLRLIGTGLYQDLLAQALRRAQGHEPESDASPELHLDVPALLPADFVPEPELRLDLYSRLARLDEAAEADEIAAEIADRFGAPPESATCMLELAGLRARCRRLGVLRLETGPKAAAATFATAAEADRGSGLRTDGTRVILDRATGSVAERLAAARDLVDRLENTGEASNLPPQARSRSA